MDPINSSASMKDQSANLLSLSPLLEGMRMESRRLSSSFTLSSSPSSSLLSSSIVDCGGNGGFLPVEPLKKPNPDGVGEVVRPAALLCVVLNPSNPSSATFTMFRSGVGFRGSFNLNTDVDNHLYHWVCLPLRC